MNKISYSRCSPVFGKSRKIPVNMYHVLSINRSYLSNLVVSVVNETNLSVLQSFTKNIFLRPPQRTVQIDKRFLHNILSSTIVQNQHDSRKKNRTIISRVCLKSTEASRNAVTSENKSVEQITINIPTEATTKSSQIKEVYYNDGEDTRRTLKLFSRPKSTLHNYYQILSEDTKQILKISPAYKLVKHRSASKWICIYHIHWPEEVKFLAKDSKKSLASHKAAIAALTWLRSEKKITDAGTPIYYDLEQVKQLSQQTIPSISLNTKTVENMRKIVEMHHSQMIPYIVSNNQVVDVNNNTIEEDKEIMPEIGNLNLRNVNKPYIGLEQYMSKEKVKLPIAAYKEEFMDLLKFNRVLIVRGEPGCGKSTRIPQYVLEAWAKEDGLLGGPGLIAVTQPRRIAAISLAERVSSERDEPAGNIVGFQVRLNSKFRQATGRILYCTTGILLRHLQSDPNLTNFSHIILDEAHERDVNTDLLMNLVKSALTVNPKLKLIVMSATIDTDMFSAYYDGAKVMNIPGFTYPVKEYFLDNCKFDVSKTLKMCEGNSPIVIHDEVVKIIQFIHQTKPEGAILCFLPGWEDINKIRKMIPFRGDIVVHCLHSRLQDSDQWKIFSRPPPGIRKIILATNIAETSVTIDDVVYVIDTGIQKDQRFDVTKGINCIDNYWISKANCTQRKGRAGRVQPGECYHLFPSSKYKTFSDYSIPEIMRTSLTKIVLDCKVFSNNMNALEFMGKLPTPPEENVTIGAVNELIDLELLDSNENLTSLGRTVADFQLEPKLSKAMVNAVVFKCVTPIVDIVTLFSAETELFVSGFLEKEEVKRIKQHFCENSDHLAMMRLFEKWLQYSQEGDYDRLRQFCDEASLVLYKMQTISKLRKIHFDYLYNGLNGVIPISDDYSDNDELVKAVLFSGVGNVLTHRNWDIVKNRLKKNVNVFLTRNNHKATITTESVNFKRFQYPTDFLLYINETRSNIRRTTLVRECSLIPEISVLLFSNKDLEIQEVAEHSSDIESDDQVKLVVQNTNIKLLCDRAQAQDIMKCKEALISSYRYFIKNLTDRGEHNPALNRSWNNILDILNEILSENRVKKLSRK